MDIEIAICLRHFQRWQAKQRPFDSFSYFCRFVKNTSTSGENEHSWFNLLLKSPTHWSTKFNKFILNEQKKYSRILRIGKYFFAFMQIHQIFIYTYFRVKEWLPVAEHAHLSICCPLVQIIALEVISRGDIVRNLHKKCQRLWEQER